MVKADIIVTMTQDFTLHTHTVGFDGKNTVREMADTARDMGFNTIGISNHFIVHPNIKESKMYAHAAARGYDAIYQDSFDVTIEKFQRHYDEIEQVAKNSKIRILRGMEVDFFNTAHWHQGFAQALKILKPDFLIGSAHFVIHDGMVCNVHDMANADNDTRDKMLNTYWQNIAQAAKSGLFTWLAHLDLPKKVGLGTDDKWADTEAQVAETLAQCGTRIELNTGFKWTDTPAVYPSNRILAHAAQHNIPAIISDDAHNIDQVGRHFDIAQQIADDNGIKLQKSLDFLLKTI